MARHVALTPTKTYASEKNVHRAVEKFEYSDDLRYFIQTIVVDGVARYFPVFVGESAVQSGVHFNFHVI